MTTTKVITMECEYCKRPATTSMEWRKTSATEEVLICHCGQRQWKFIEKEASEMKPEYLTLNQ